MDKAQTIKIHLVALAEYLQCTLTDAQVLMYAKELDMDPDQLALAIAFLKQDPEVWSGRFPLPAKIKSYLFGDAEHKANSMVVNILRLIDSGGNWKDLSEDEKEVVRVYGWTNLNNMLVGQRPNYITNMRSIAKTIITNKARPDLMLAAPEQKQIGDDTWEQP